MTNPVPESTLVEAPSVKAASPKPDPYTETPASLEADQRPDSKAMTVGAPELEPMEIGERRSTSTSESFYETITIPGATMAWSGRKAMPVTGQISSRWGPRSDGHHEGLDIAVPIGTPVRSPVNGQVISAQWIGTWGNQIRVRAPNGEVHLMAHLSRFDAKVGDRVQAGQVIARSGNTGRSTGPHVHWEVWSNGNRASNINPESWWQAAARMPTAAQTASGGAVNVGGQDYIAQAQIEALARQVGFNPYEARIAAAIAMGESSGFRFAYNGRGLDRSYGLMQINMLGRMGSERRAKFGLSSNSALYDPLTNMRVAYSLYRARGNFSDWSVYNSGAYRKYL